MGLAWVEVVVVSDPQCSRCGQSTDHRPLPTSEILSILGEALAVRGDSARLLDLIAVRCSSATQRLLFATTAVMVLGWPRVRDVAGVIAEEPLSALPTTRARPRPTRLTHHVAICTLP